MNFLAILFRVTGMFIGFNLVFLIAMNAIASNPTVEYGGTGTVEDPAWVRSETTSGWAYAYRGQSKRTILELEDEPEGLRDEELSQVEGSYRTRRSLLNPSEEIAYNYQRSLEIQKIRVDPSTNVFPYGSYTSNDITSQPHPNNPGTEILVKKARSFSSRAKYNHQVPGYFHCDSLFDEENPLLVAQGITDTRKFSCRFAFDFQADSWSLQLQFYDSQLGTHVESDDGDFSGYGGSNPYGGGGGGSGGTSVSYDEDFYSDWPFWSAYAVPFEWILNVGDAITFFSFGVNEHGELYQLREWSNEEVFKYHPMA